MITPGLRRTLVWSCLCVAVMIDLALAWGTPGTYDVQLYARYGAQLAATDLATAYSSSDVYNIPPLAAGYAALLAVLVGPTSPLFGFFLRLPGIAAEAVFAIVLWRRSRNTGTPPAWVAMLFMLNPVSILITGYHGNLDGLLAVFIGASLLAAADDRPISSGVWLGLAANLKVAPILLMPAFLLWWWKRGRAVPFAAAAGAIVIAGWSPGLIACPRLFLERVLFYGSIWGTWGISHILLLTGPPAFEAIVYGAPSPAANLIASGLKGLIVVGACTLAWRRRKLDAMGLFGTIAATWTMFFVFAPGGAAQYMIWLVIPLLLAHPRLGVDYILAATPFMIVFYQPAVAFLFNASVGQIFGLRISPSTRYISWTWPGLFLWLALVVVFIRQWATWWRPAALYASDPPPKDFTV